MVGSTADDVADEAEVGRRVGAAVISSASSPDMPTASGPCTLMAETMSRLTLPTSTIRAISRVSASVTRSPLRNSVSLPSRAISSPICGPPPCTTTGSIPTARISTTSWANEARGAPSLPRPAVRRVERVAAVLDDDDLAPEAVDVRQRFDEHGAVLARRSAGSPSAGWRPARCVMTSSCSRRCSRTRGRSRARRACPAPSPRSQSIWTCRPAMWAATARPVVRRLHPAGAHDDAAVGDRDAVEVEGRARGAELGDDATPVGIPAEERALARAGARDLARGGVRRPRRSLRRARGCGPPSWCPRRRPPSARPATRTPR